MFLLELLLGWFLADLWSGIFHAVGDSKTLGNSKLVKIIVSNNESHHEKPLAIVDQDFVPRNITSWIGTLLIAIPWFWFFGPSWVLAGMIAGGLMVSEVHRWAHAPSKTPNWAKYVQRTGLFQSPKHHSLHHRPPHSVRFCLLTDYVNPILDRMLWK
jgi:ubiquitin-conjugating enzyme E2 variant